MSVQVGPEYAFTRKTAQTGAVTLIQRFGSALNLNVHFHGAHPCAPPFGQPAVVQIGCPADLSYAVSGRRFHHHLLGQKPISSYQHTESARIGGVGAYDQPTVWLDFWSEKASWKGIVSATLDTGGWLALT
jgi:hypothetical protein